MRFPPSFIERLRSHFLMSEVIGKRIPLKKHGREYQGLCPFHNEKTPSFTVNDEKGFYHCFGCGAHGDAIEFVRKFERLSYPEAIETLARDGGIPLPRPTEEEARKVESEKTLYEVLEAAAKWFELQLASTSGMVARDYIEKRGLRPETIRQFRIGYAPDERNALYNHLLKAGFNQALQQEAGLVGVSEQGGSVYDRFRGRVMFPIRNSSGKVIAFGGRLLGSGSNKSLPKYLNSPETPVFRKGELLYNIDLAKKPARVKDKVVVMEGYMDVVSTWQAGIEYAVATLGTAVTQEHLRLLWQLTKEPILCLDGDAAGKRAMMRATEIALPALKPRYSLRFTTLPKEEDPDSFVQKHGKGSFERLLNESRRLLETIWEDQRQQYQPDVPGELAALEEACNQIIDKITDPIVKKDYRTHISSHIAALRNQTWKKNAAAVKNNQTRAPEVEHMALRQRHTVAMDSLVMRMLATLVKFPELLHKSHIEETLARLEINSRHLDLTRTALLDAAHHAGIDNRQLFLAYLDKRLHGKLPEPPKQPEKEAATLQEALHVWNDTVSVYDVGRLEFELKELQETVGQAMDNDSYSRMLELQQAIRAAKARRTFAPAEADGV